MILWWRSLIAARRLAAVAVAALALTSAAWSDEVTSPWRWLRVPSMVERARCCRRTSSGGHVHLRSDHWCRHRERHREGGGEVQMGTAVRLRVRHRQLCEGSRSGDRRREDRPGDGEGLSGVRDRRDRAPRGRPGG